MLQYWHCLSAGKALFSCYGVRGRCLLHSNMLLELLQLVLISMSRLVHCACSWDFCCTLSLAAFAGRFAQQKELLIDKTRHHVLKAAHPSGLSANKVC